MVSTPLGPPRASLSIEGDICFKSRPSKCPSESSFRVAVEHRIGRTKRFRIIAERFRNPLRTHHAKTSIVAGLVNVEVGLWS